ncbi:hypothetical protein BSL78_09454 [Apostichopus japonicus]|uniref:Uncharacterized protein n=1 Tax=Stichopus japonicus TaxID=307972 RepID=A0A2G8L099_STIJA|nr:hypothetical protein BSL78_09454 [Apostichopus japonicus]
MERNKFFQLFHLALILIDMTDAGKLCDFAAKFPCKGSHCLPSPCKGKTTQESKEPTTGVTTEPQGTALGVSTSYRWLYEFLSKLDCVQRRVCDSRNLWLGNEKLHYLTNQRNYKLRFDITTSSGWLNS